jgi:hypothetical protein
LVEIVRNESVMFRMASIYSSLQSVGSNMSKLVGLAAVDWSYCYKYMTELDRSGRKRLERWEIELKNWDPDDESTMPSGYALASLRDAVRELSRRPLLE